MKKIFLLLSAVTLLLAGCSQKKENTNIRYATFNIRMDTPRDSLNNWKYRSEAVCNFILDEQLDIVGMQEVLHNQLEDLKAGLNGYAYVGIGREDGNTKGEYAPLFYRSDKFEVLDSNTFWLSQYPDSVGFIGWDGACTRIATWAKFKDKSNGRIFMSVNTHFDHVGKEARKNAALLIIDRIKEIVGDRPAILTGDFNVTDESEAYTTLTTNSYVLKDAWKTAAQKETGSEYTYHEYGRLPKEVCPKIDFIFVSEGITVNKAFIPYEGDGPTGYLSDHNPHVADIEF